MERLSSSDMAAMFGDHEDEEEELEAFDDFTIASPWERLIAGVESACRRWMAVGLEGLQWQEAGVPAVPGTTSLLSVFHEQPYGTKSYGLTLFFPSPEEGQLAAKEGRTGGTASGPGDEWSRKGHPVELCFGVDLFLVLAPISMSGVVLDQSEASILLSTLACALASCECPWPAFVPVHDSARKAFVGIQQLPGGGPSVRFEADRLKSHVPPALLHLEGLYELFASKLAGDATYLSRRSSPHVLVSMRMIYRTHVVEDGEGGDGNLSPSTDEEEAEGRGWGLGGSLWDEDCPWGEWHSMEDPIKGYEVAATWRLLRAHNSASMAKLEQLPPMSANHWSVKVVPTNEEMEEWPGFAGRLRLLARSLQQAAAASETFHMDDFISEEGRAALKKFGNGASMAVPTHSVISRVLRDLFDDAPTVAMGSEAPLPKPRMVAKTAPPDSLLARLCLHVLRFGDCNIKAIAALWKEFRAEVTWYWEEAKALPRVASTEPPDFACCLLHQKLQMLAICIKHKVQAQRRALEGRAAEMHESRSRANQDAPTRHQAAPEGARGKGMDKLEGGVSGEGRPFGGGEARKVASVGQPEGGGVARGRGGVSGEGQSGKAKRLGDWKERVAERTIGSGGEVDLKVELGGGNGVRGRGGNHMEIGKGGREGEGEGDEGRKEMEEMREWGEEDDDGKMKREMGEDGEGEGEVEGGGHVEGEGWAGLEDLGDDEMLMSASSSRQHWAGSEPRAGANGERGMDESDVEVETKDDVSSDSTSFESFKDANSQLELGYDSEASEGGAASGRAYPPEEGSAGEEDGKRTTDSDAPAGARRGALAPVGGLMLLGVPRRMFAPITQEAPFVTEDTLLQSHEAMEAVGNGAKAAEARARIQGNVLLSDMSAFKAANPGAVLADFVRWHSPRDWLPEPPHPLSPRHLDPPQPSQGRDHLDPPTLGGPSSPSPKPPVGPLSALPGCGGWERGTTSLGWDPRALFSASEGCGPAGAEAEVDEDGGAEPRLDWPPRGQLSERMRGGEGASLWAQLWERAPAVTAAEQRPLFDHVREAEKALHYLDTIRPLDLMAQMLCTAFTSAAHVMAQSNGSDLAPVAAGRLRLEDLMSTRLDPTGTRWIQQEDGETGVSSSGQAELRVLCEEFQRVEALGVAAAAMWRKLSGAPRLMATLLDPEGGALGNASVRLADDSGAAAQGAQPTPQGVARSNGAQGATHEPKGGDSERAIVAGLFDPHFVEPRKTKRGRKRPEKMGSLLNGHEPCERELIMTCPLSGVGERGLALSGRGMDSDNEGVSLDAKHRMYVKGTLEDLQLAVSLVALD